MATTNICTNHIDRLNLLHHFENYIFYFLHAVFIFNMFDCRTIVKHIFIIGLSLKIYKVMKISQLRRNVFIAKVLFSVVSCLSDEISQIKESFLL